MSIARIAAIVVAVAAATAVAIVVVQDGDDGIEVGSATATPTATPVPTVTPTATSPSPTPESEPEPTSDPAPTPPPARECSGERWTLTVPAGWSVDDEVSECALFSSRPVDLRPGTDEVVDIALSVDSRSTYRTAVARLLGTPELYDVRADRELVVDGQPATVIDSITTGNGLLDAGIDQRFYIVDLGDVALMAVATDLPASDYDATLSALDELLAGIDVDARDPCVPDEPSGLPGFGEPIRLDFDLDGVDELLVVTSTNASGANTGLFARFGCEYESVVDLTLHGSVGSPTIWGCTAAADGTTDLVLTTGSFVPESPSSDPTYDVTTDVFDYRFGSLSLIDTFTGTTGPELDLEGAPFPAPCA